MNHAFIAVRGGEYRIIDTLEGAKAIDASGWRLAGAVVVPENFEALYQVFPNEGPQPEIDRILLIEAAREYTARVRKEV